MSWDQNDFDENLSRATPSIKQLSQDDAEFQNPSEIVGQTLKSVDNSLVIDLANNKITKSDGRFARQILPNFLITVAQDGSGDFGDLQQAINYVSQLGGGTIQLKAGTYNMTGPISLLSNIAIIGEGIGNTILNFSGLTNLTNSAAIEIMGKQLDVAFSNTLTSGSGTLTGTLTTWTKPGIQYGDSVALYGEPLAIDHVIDDTHISLINAYQGATNSFSSGFIYRPVKNVRLSGITIKGAASNGIRLRYCENIEIDNCEIYGFTGTMQQAGIKVDVAFNTLITQNFIHDNQRGILIGDILYYLGLQTPTIGNGTTQNLQSITILANQITNNTKDGVRAELAGLINISNNSCRGNGLAGIFLRMCTDCQINGNVCNYNVDGIRLWSYEAGPQQGIAASMQNTNVVGNICSNNSANGILIRASMSSIVVAQVQYPQDISVSSNEITSNAGWGIRLNGATETVGDNAETS